MQTDEVSVADERPTRLRALFNRIGRLPDEDLPEIERAVTRAEMRTRVVEPPHDPLSAWERALASSADGLCMYHARVEERGEWQVTMHLCPRCGNKRCPKAENHAFVCSGSNAVGQVGDLEYPDPIVAPVVKAYRVPPEFRRDLDSLSDAIHALPGKPVMGKAIGDGR